MLRMQRSRYPRYPRRKTQLSEIRIMTYSCSPAPGFNPSISHNAPRQPLSPKRTALSTFPPFILIIPYNSRSKHRQSNPPRLHHANSPPENDVLFLRQQGKRAPKWHLTAPLRADSRIRLSYGGSVNSSDLIGRSVLDTVVDSSGRSVVLHEPSMASYIINSSRYATPVQALWYQLGLNYG